MQRELDIQNEQEIKKKKSTCRDEDEQKWVLRVMLQLGGHTDLSMIPSAMMASKPRLQLRTMSRSMTLLQSG